MNKVFLMGRLTRDVELRSTQSGKAVGSFTLAVNRNFKNQAGEYEADFINCTAWGKTGETISKFFKKGNLIVVEGAIQTSNYQAEDGTTRYKTEINVSSFYFAESKNSSREESNNNTNKNQNGNQDFDKLEESATSMLENEDDFYKEINKTLISDEELPF